jgi:hypothetical protein
MALRKLEDKPKLYPIITDSNTEVNESAPIPGGYYIMARKIDESEIAHAAPCIRELWYWLLRQVNHKDNPTLGINRGQCVRTIADMQDGLHWFVGYRKMTYSKTQCEGALEFLRKRLMVTTTKTTRGLIITVCNYEFYNNPKNYEDNSEGNKKTTRRQQGCSTINKNDNNDKNEIDSIPPKADTKKAFYEKQIADNLDKPEIEQYKQLVGFLYGNNKNEIVFNNVLSLTHQISFKNFLKLTETAKNSQRTIGQVLVSMENKVTLKKDYSSVFLTVNTWLQNDFSKK